MLAVDLAILVGIGAIAVSVAGFFGWKISKLKKEERLGEQNAEAVDKEVEQHCVMCTKKVDPAHDVLFRKNWWCRGCYKEIKS